MIVSAPALKDDQAAALVGRWVTVRCVQDGEDKTAANSDMEYEFRANGAWVPYRDGKTSWKVPGRYAVDPGPDPDVLDIVPMPDLPLNGNLRGIYRIDRDTLTWQYRSNPGRGPPYRPKNFGPTETGDSLLVMRRVRPK